MLSGVPPAALEASTISRASCEHKTQYLVQSPGKSQKCQSNIFNMYLGSHFQGEGRGVSVRNHGGTLDLCELLV